MSEPIQHYITCIGRLDYMTLCGRRGFGLVGICDPESKRGITCKSCRKVWNSRHIRKGGKS